MVHQQTRKRRGGCLSVVAILVLGLAAVFGLDFVIRAIDAPWSIDTGGGTLTGTWVGPIRARLGAEYVLYLDLGVATGSRRATSPLSWSQTSLIGTGLICSRHGEQYEYEVSGQASRAADRVEIRLTYVDPAQSGLWMSLEGAWNGNTLTLTPTRNPFLPDGTFRQIRTVSSSDPDDSFAPTELRVGTRAEFDAACQRLLR